MRVNENKKLGNNSNTAQRAGDGSDEKEWRLENVWGFHNYRRNRRGDVYDLHCRQLFSFNMAVSVFGRRRWVCVWAP